MRRCTSAKLIEALPKREVGRPLQARTRLPQLMCMMVKSPSGRSSCIFAREGNARRRRRRARRVYLVRVRVRVRQRLGLGKGS